MRKTVLHGPWLWIAHKGEGELSRGTHVTFLPKYKWDMASLPISPTLLCLSCLDCHDPFKLWSPNPSSFLLFLVDYLVTAMRRPFGSSLACPLSSRKASLCHTSCWHFLSSLSPPRSISVHSLHLAAGFGGPPGTKS